MRSGVWPDWCIVVGEGFSRHVVWFGVLGFWEALCMWIGMFGVGVGGRLLRFGGENKWGG